MKNDADYFLTIDIADDQKLRFESPDRITEWVRAEQSFWNWTRSVQSKPYGVNDDAVAPWREKLDTASGHMTTVMNSSISIGERNNAINTIKAVLTEYARENFLSTSPRAVFIKMLFDAEGPVLALAALNHALGGEHSAGNSQTRKILRRARGAIDAFDTGLAKALPSAVAASIKKMVNGYQSSLEAEIAGTRAALKALEDKRGAIAEEWKALSESVNNRIDDHGARLQQDSDAAIERIETTRKAYQEFMHLGASVDYWNTKAAAHEANSSKLQRTLIWFASSAGVVLAIFLGYLGFLGIGVALHKDASPAAPLLFIGIGLVATTGVMWVGRVLVRLFLSEHHLAIDARERAVMAQTFLALTNEGKIEPSERALVLAPMFRPTADGIVKDDGAPDATIAGHLSRMLGR